MLRLLYLEMFRLSLTAPFCEKMENNKKNPPEWEGRKTEINLLGLGQLTGHARLFTVRSILRDNALSSGLIDSRRGGAQHFSGRGLGGRGGVKLLDRGLGGGLDHLVAEGLVLNNADALDSRFNVRQRNSHPRV